ncbi:MAG TPA: phospholipase D-like domain-containing protein [Gemmatimonadales bacterium]|nr:phospholipase D-like domain-containing protein [Gemmatimonadales bacterium]
MNRPVPDAIAHAVERAADARPIGGNTLEHLPDSPAAIQAMLDSIAGAERWVHLENYIIRSDRTGWRFAEALTSRARAGVRVRVLYDALGSFGTRRSYWRALRRAGVEVRAFHPILTSQPFDLFLRDHRKLLVVDGVRAVTGGLCLGDEWAGDPARHRRPWRDSMAVVCGPAAAALDHTFADVWSKTGPPLADDELSGDPAPCGTTTVQVVAGVPFEARLFRAVQVIAAAVTERLWITDAYMVPPAPLYTALRDAARAGVDVRVLVPGVSDLAVLRNLTRVGYRDLLRAGVRVFEWRGPMIHAKTLVADHRWARLGSSNLNVSSLLGNYELDLLADNPAAAETLATQFRRDLLSATEVILQPRRPMLPPRLVHESLNAGAESEPRLPLHKRSGYELGAVAVVALRRVAGGLRRSMAAAAALACLALGALQLLFPRVMSAILAVGSFWLALGFGAYTLGKRRVRVRDAE